MGGGGGGGGVAHIASHLNGENHSGGDSVALDCRDRVFFSSGGGGEGASSRCYPSECRINLVVRERVGVGGGGGGGKGGLSSLPVSMQNHSSGESAVLDVTPLPTPPHPHHHRFSHPLSRMTGL